MRNRRNRTWALWVSELSTWATLAAVFLVLQVEDLASTTYRISLGVVALAAGSTFLFFRVAFPRSKEEGRLLLLGVALGYAFSFGIFLLLHRSIPSAFLVFVPLIVASGLLGSLTAGLAIAGVSVLTFLVVVGLTDELPNAGTVLLDAGVLGFCGWLSATLARELRERHRSEADEHRQAAMVRYRLLALLDAVDEAIVFSDRNGVVRLLNKQASTLFEADPRAYIGQPVVQLLRTVARQTEDPEGFMESFQGLRDDPSAELKLDVEQLIPKRRALRLYSAPAFDDDSTLVGRIDAYSDVTENVANAVQAERLYREARATAESYQRALLPDSVPKLPRISFVASYLPAAGNRAVCGDFYDFITSHHGKLGVLLGDVCGIGPAAVNDAALTRYTLRSFAPYEDDPARLLERTNQRVTDHLNSERFVRMLFGVLDPERAVFEYANAGHVPPLLYRTGTGEVEWLGEGGLPLGIEREAAYKIGRIELEPGDMLFLYTDGVTEAPRRGRPFGQGKLSDLMREYGVGTPGELVQAIRRSVENWVDADLRDDLAMLSFQVVPDAAADGLTRELVIPNEPQRTREVRQFVADFLADLRAPIDTTYDILLAVGEAAGNAAKYGARKEIRSEMRIRCVLEDQTVRIVVADEGPGFDLSALSGHASPDPLASGGRGMFLMNQLMDELDVETSPSGTTVTMSRRIFT
ncbi:MAG: phosphoserine phosphatase RsbU/P [Actinomycetota bacterium]|nr:phosphoserine phosphatase RsbU/P [Actinomycetota bacterium]